MGCTLTWEIIPKKTNYVSGFQLRNILESKFGYPHILDGSHVSYLEALKDAGIEEAQELIDAIEKHDEIRIDKEC